MRLILLVIFCTTFQISALGYADDTVCEARWFCHDRGMPSAEDETHHNISDFVVVKQNEVFFKNQTDTYDYGSPAPKIIWSETCNKFDKTIEAYLSYDKSTQECTRYKNDG